MFIKEVTIENYKGFKGTHSFEFNKNLIFFVGNNNTGKSTVFEAIDFLKSGLPATKDIKDLRNKNSNNEITVTVKFQDNIKAVIEDFSQSKYMNYVFDEDGKETLLAQRTSKSNMIKQKGKDVAINIKKITLWNPETKQFENPSGIDAVFKTLFEAQFVWADTNPDDIADFGTTKICGRLLFGAIGDFFDSPQWQDFTEVHQKTFHGGKDSLVARTKTLEKEIESVLTSQHGSANVIFNFQLPDPTSFIKAGGIDINDGTTTSSKDKGTGMQRALALALIQIYADKISRHPDDSTKIKPLFLFIDEPETFLHPLAQDKFLEALNTISNLQQIFVTTHSPYLLKSYDPNRHILYAFSKNTSSNTAEPSSNLVLFGKSSPTWGEINYFAYEMPSVEFHNELYGFLQAKAITIDPLNDTEEKFDNFLVNNGLKYSREWTREKNGQRHPDKKFNNYDVTIQTYIRNKVHHPENQIMQTANFSREELKTSTEEMIDLMKKLT